MQACIRSCLMTFLEAACGVRREVTGVTRVWVVGANAIDLIGR